MTLFFIIIILISLYFIYYLFNYKKTNNINDDYDLNYYIPEENFKSVLNPGQEADKDKAMYEDDLYFYPHKKNGEFISMIEPYSNTIKMTDREQINKFNDSFFNFNNRINQMSMYDDPVDRINRQRTNGNFNVGLDIKQVYDDLVQPIL